MKRTISAVLCAALALTLAGCAEEKEPMLDRTVTVETTAAQTGELSTESTYIGTISAEGTASVVSLVSGNVEEVMVSVGDTVSAGDPLCRIDDESARLALQNAQAAYQSARESYNSAQAGYGGADLPVLEEQLRLAQDNYEDTQHLFEMGAASQAEVDQANQALLSAQAGVEAARAGLSSARAGIALYRYLYLHLLFHTLQNGSRHAFNAEWNAPLPITADSIASADNLIPDYYPRPIPRLVSCYALFK